MWRVTCGAKPRLTSGVVLVTRHPPLITLLQGDGNRGVRQPWRIHRAVNRVNHQRYSALRSGIAFLASSGISGTRRARFSR